VCVFVCVYVYTCVYMCILPRPPFESAGDEKRMGLGDILGYGSAAGVLCKAPGALRNSAELLCNAA
jgi:hypothetical protein